MSGKTFSNVRTSRLYCTLSSSFLGIAVILVILLIFSVVMTKVDVPDSIMSVFTVLALCSGCFTGSYVASRRHRHNGLATGIITGIITYFLILLIGIIFSKSSLHLGLFSKLIIAVVCGGLGGIVGVNSRQKRY